MIAFFYMFHGVILGRFLGWSWLFPQAKRKLHEMLTKLCRQENIRDSAASAQWWGRGDNLPTQIGVVFRWWMLVNTAYIEWVSGVCWVFCVFFWSSGGISWQKMSKPPLRDGRVSGVPKKRIALISYYASHLIIWLGLLRGPEFWDGLKYGVSVDLPVHIGNDAWFFWRNTDVFWAILRIYAGPTWGTEWGDCRMRGWQEGAKWVLTFSGLGKNAVDDGLTLNRKNLWTCFCCWKNFGYFFLIIFMGGNLSSEIKFRVLSGKRSNYHSWHNQAACFGMLFEGGLDFPSWMRHTTIIQ